MSEQNVQQRLAALLDAKAENGVSMRLDEVQAYLLAVLSGPDEYVLQDCVREVLADESFSDEEQAEITLLLDQMADGIKADLQAKKLPTLLFYPDEQGETDYFTFCNAYLFALDTVPSDWFERANNEDFEDLFYPLMALAGVYDADEHNSAIIQLSERELKQLKDELATSLLDIALFWQAVLNKPQTVKRSSTKVGRNDPCPCGSNKKFKACCQKN